MKQQFGYCCIVLVALAGHASASGYTPYLLLNGAFADPVQGQANNRRAVDCPDASPATGAAISDGTSATAIPIAGAIVMSGGDFITSRCPPWNSVTRTCNADCVRFGSGFCLQPNVIDAAQFGAPEFVWVLELPGRTTSRTENKKSNDEIKWRNVYALMGISR